MISKYGVVESYNIDSLEEKINRYIKDGWQPYNSLIVVSDADTFKYVQVMVKGSVNFKKYVGVEQLHTGRYRATLWAKGKSKHVGVYDTEIEAVIGRNNYINEHKLSNEIQEIE